MKEAVRGFHGIDFIIILVLLTELVKLFTCVVIYLFNSRANIFDLIADLRKNSKLLLLYLVPASLYCIYNVLSYRNIKLFDLTTYYCSTQLRIVVTALVYQILFRRKLTALQWASLFILTLGCILKQYSFQASKSSEHTNTTLLITTEKTLVNVTKGETITTKNHDVESTYLNWLTLLLQIFCSCLAGVYNEYLLKDSSTSSNAGIILQNIFMYIDSILCNMIALKVNPYLFEASEELQADKSSTITLYNSLNRSVVIGVIIVNALCGLVTSWFLKDFNSILKNFAAAIELFAIAILAWLIYDDALDKYTIIALFLVTASLIVYSRNPVSVAPPSRPSPEKEGFILLPTSGD